MGHVETTKNLLAEVMASRTFHWKEAVAPHVFSCLDVHQYVESCQNLLTNPRGEDGNAGFLSLTIY